MPGPYSSIGSAGKSGLTWSQVVTSPSASGAHSVLSSSVVRQVMKSLSADATTVSASVATWSSVYSIPFFSQIAISSSSIGREALEMSVSPMQNFSKPPPVPEVPTETLTSEFSPLNSSPAAEVSGSTVDEPSTTTSPDAPSSPPLVAGSLLPPQAARPRESTSAAGRAMRLMVLRFTYVNLSMGARFVGALVDPDVSDAKDGR